MHVWIVQIGEMISGVDGNVRDYRYTTLAREISSRGHIVMRWSSTFEHVSKKFRAQESTTIELSKNLKVRLLHAQPGYRRNISLSRFIQQRSVAKLFLEETTKLPPPDLIVVGVPVPELAEAAVKFGNKNKVPVIVDAQDQWPDIYLTAIPRLFRPVAKLLLHKEFLRSHRLFAGAKSITAVSNTYLDWALRRARRRRGIHDGVYPLGFKSIGFKSDISQRKILIRKEYGIPLNSFIAIFIGTFGSSYDIETIVRCAKILEQLKEPKVHIILVGDGDKMRKAKNIAADCGNITITGWLGRDQVHDLAAISSAGLCAYSPTALQSIPYKPLEYMAFGLPLISSLDGELRFIIESNKCGLYYRAGDPQSLVDKIQILASSPLLAKQMGILSRQLFEDQYDSMKIYPSMADKVLSVA